MQWFEAHMPYKTKFGLNNACCMMIVSPFFRQKGGGGGVKAVPTLWPSTCTCSGG